VPPASLPIECVVNVSEGRDERVLAELSTAAGPVLLDRHTDPDHHRSVFTLAGAADDVTLALKELASACVARLDLGAHQGAHPRLGVLDVVPLVPFVPGRPPSHDLSGVVPWRDEFARWLSATFDLPSFLYGPLPDGQVRTLPQVRRLAFTGLAPDFGPAQPHRTAGATAVGARPVLVAYNLWVSSVAVARRVAPLVRSSAVRALGLAVGERAQVSCNLVDPADFGPAQLYDLVVDLVTEAGGAVTGAELVGLIPQSILAAIPAARWAELALSPDVTIESRLRR
jgi:glutamate formiminotransferase